MQLQVAALYWHTFWSKLQGVTWHNGTAVYYAARIPEIFHWPLPYIFDHLWTCQLFTYMTLSIEFSMFSLVWFPPVGAVICRWIALGYGCVAEHSAVSMDDADRLYLFLGTGKL